MSRISLKRDGPPGQVNRELLFELVAILRLINNREVMGQHVNGRFYNILAWSIVVSISLLSGALIGITVLGWFGIGPGR